jgi:hypothetical protein
MRHLSRTELLDIVDPHEGAALAVERRHHVDTCDACRTEVTTLRATLAEARQDAGGEPSPLFWDHFAARVSEAIRDESPDTVEPARLSWFGGQAAAWTVAVLMVVLGMTTVAWRATLHAPTAAGGGTTVVTTTPAEAPRLGEDPDDRAWKIVQSAADGLQLDDAQAAEIGARPGSAERVVMDLTDDERAELARLLESEMKRTGA